MGRYIIIFLLILLPLTAFSQETDNDDESYDIDNLFQEDLVDNGEKEQSEENDVHDNNVQDADEPSKDPLKKLAENTEITLKGGVYVEAGYSGGWGELDFNAPYEQTGVLKTSANLRLNIQIGRPLRLFMMLKFDYPGFALTMHEIFIDYNLKDVFMARIGREYITWGISRAYPFTNLTARLPDNFTGSTDSFSLRLTVPVGVGSIQALAFSRMGFTQGSEYPALKDIGYGGLFNFFFWKIDATIGVFWQEQLNTRIFYSAKTTLFDKLEFYSEGLLAIYTGTASGYNVGWGINAGFYIDFFNRNLRFNGEYYYNGEQYIDPVTGYQQPNMDIHDRDYDLIPGHNISLGVEGFLLNKRLKLYVQWLHNFDRNTGALIPGIDFSFFEYFTISLKTPVILGSSMGHYAGTKNPDPLDRRMAFVITAKFIGGF